MKSVSVKMLRSILILIIILGAVYSRNFDYMNEEDYEAFFDLEYGEFERNKFDLILPTENSPHALVIYIHGGGFKKGDKKDLYNRKDDIKYFIDNSIAVATVNYRFYSKNDSMGVKICLQDIKQAIQYIRFNAGKYNIDKSQVACYGVSAGAGSSLYFAFHDDMAVAGDTTLSGESTKIKCAGAIDTQSTYNLFRWKGIIPWFRFVSWLKRDTFNHSLANFYGFKDYGSFKKYRKEITKNLDMLKMIDAHDPPVYLVNLMTEYFPDNDDIVFHHRNHAIAVSKKLNKFDVPNYLFTCKNISEYKEFPIREFLVQNLK